MTLKEKINELLDVAIRRTRSVEELKNFSILKQLKENFNQPLTVAVTGLIKAGKSTLINALINERLLITNPEEATYTITRFKYSERPYLKLILKNGNSVEDSIEHLDYWTSRSKKKENKRLDDVETVIIGYPIELFKKLEIIDTPGLGSAYGIDSDNTKEFLGTINKNDLNQSTQLTEREMSKADAIICAFRSNLRESDLNNLQDYLKNFGMIGNPINAVGVLTRCDNYFIGHDIAPCEKGEEIIKENYMQKLEVKKSLYLIQPVCALPSEGLTQMDDKQLAVFKQLGTLDDEDLFDLLNGQIFCCYSDKDFAECAEDETLIIPLEDRKELYRFYGSYGIYLITQLARKECSKEEIIAAIASTTGIHQLLDIIISHFGNRADIIKAQLILNRLKNMVQNTLIRKRDNKWIGELMDDLYDACDALLTQEHAFKELSMLKDYYSNNIHLNEEDVQDLLCLTGEFGYNCEARLGVPQEKKNIQELRDLALIKLTKWSQKANEPLITKSERRLANVIKRSCEIIYNHLEKLSDY